MSTRRNVATISVVVFFLSSYAARVVGNERAVLEKIRTSHAAALASIDTLSCDVEIIYDPKPGWGDERGKCWKSGENIRCTCESRLRKNDVIADGSRVTSLNTSLSPNGADISATITNENRPIRCNPWSYGLLTFYGHKVYRVTLDELLAQPHRLLAAKMVSEDGQDFGYIDLSHDRARLEIWFDPRVNYLARKVVLHMVTPQGKNQRGEHVVSRFHEAAPGIFFPERVRTQTYEEDKQNASFTVVFSNIEMNKPLPENTFILRYPPGILVSDMIQGKMFKTDESGEPRLPPTDKQGRLLHLTTVPPIQKPDEADALQVTQKEAQPWTRWLIPAALVVLGAAGILWIIERRRRMKPA